MRLLVRYIDIFIEISVDLVTDLNDIAAVDKHSGLVFQHDSRTSRATKAGEPCQTLRIFADIFAHMLITDRHDKAVEAIFLHLFPQRLETGFISRHQHRRANSLNKLMVQHIGVRRPIRHLNPAGDIERI